MLLNSYFLRDLVTCTGGWEILSVSGRLLDNLGELADALDRFDFNSQEFNSSGSMCRRHNGWRLLPTSQPSEDARLARRQHYRAVREYCLGGKNLG